MSPRARLLALDWGTTSLRAYLLGDGGAVIDRRVEPWGVMHLPAGGFRAAFDAVTRDWHAQDPGLPAIAAGMVGSAQGWVEAPYCRAPAGAAELASALVRVDGTTLHVVPGVASFDGLPEVMRGEEAQIVGALELRPELAGDEVLVLPGTHSKWVHVRAGMIRSFGTAMTGELFAVLRDHSILGRPARDAGREPSREESDAAFRRGVLAIRSSPYLSMILFSARTMVLAGQVAPEVSLDYLSGLLIGEEVQSRLTARIPTLVGDGPLCKRYLEVFRMLGPRHVLVIDEAAPTGLWRIAELAGLT